MVSLRRRDSSSGGGLRIRKKARGFMCGCGGTKAVSISDGASDKHSPLATPPTTAVSSTPTTTTSFTTTTTATANRAAGTRRRAGNKQIAAAAAPSSFSPSSSWYAGEDSTDDAHSSGVDGTPSLSTLLRQLRDLERSVRFLHSARPPGAPVAADARVADNDVDATSKSSSSSGGGNSGRGRRHRRTASAGGRVEESVAVVKESADPLGDFRRSMLQMIVEKEIVGGAELRELLRRFLALNSPQHHHLILQAFAEIWEEVFAGYDDQTPDLLAPHRHRGENKTAVRA